MEPYRLKVRVGLHEFDAEGSQEAVERQFALWRDLVSSTPSSPTTLPSPPPPAVGVPAPVTPATPPAPAEDLPFDKVFKHDGRVVTITVLPQGERREQDAALMVLLGQQHYNRDDQVTGQTLLDGLKRSGVSVERADRMFGDYMEKYVLRSGIRRAVKYRLTNPGVAKAKEIVGGLLAMVS